MSESSNVQERKHERNQRASVSKAEARSALITVFLDDLLEGGGSTVEPFRTPDGEPFARIQVDEHWELFSLETRKTSPLKLWIRRAFWQRDRGILKPSELTEIIDRLDAAARFGDHVPVSLVAWPSTAVTFISSSTRLGPSKSVPMAGALLQIRLSAFCGTTE